ATAAAIAVDAQGNAYIGGKSTAGHAYVVKLSADGSTFLYNASLAGSGQESAGALVADAAGNVVVAGTTSSPDFPVSAGAVQSRLAGAQNAFAAGLDTAGHVAFSTYLGGSGTDTPAVLQTDGAGNIFVAGATSSLDFPTTPGSFQASPVVPLWNNGAPAGFIAKLSANGGTLLYASYVMSADGGLQTGVASLAVTASGEAYIAGVTGAGFPVTPSAPQPCFEGPTADFVAHLDPRGVLLDSTFVGKNTNFAFGLGVQGDGSLLFAWHASGPNSLSRIRFGGAGWTAPACLSSWALNAATMSSGDGGLALGEMVTFTGFGIGPEIGVAYQPDAHGQIPRSLAGVQVLFDRQPAPVLYAQSQQVNVVAPSQISGTGFTIVSLVYNGVTVGSMTVPVDVAAPGIFRLQPGVSSQAAAVNQDGSVNGPANPAPAGSVVAIWVTGIGPLAIPCAGGGMNLPDAVSMADGWSVQIFDGRRTPAQFAGNAPGLPCGVQQVNFVVPEYAQSLYRFALVSTDGQSGVMGSVFATIAVR
ncbi:MAG TPA: SBBP repeat-containing protein, partial [Candidatus Sulfopaludibacter sp.]|nr:SBBP repeat-containing protein [Candidatus Sulfopaludibacter sp.]